MKCSADVWPAHCLRGRSRWSKALVPVWWWRLLELHPRSVSGLFCVSSLRFATSLTVAPCRMLLRSVSSRSLCCCELHLLLCLSVMVSASPWSLSFFFFGWSFESLSFSSLFPSFIYLFASSICWLAFLIWCPLCSLCVECYACFWFCGWSVGLSLVRCVG